MYDLLGMAATNLYRIDGSSRKDALETFHRNVSNIMIQQTEHRAERSCSLRPRKAVAFLTHLRPAPKSKGAGSFAVCGQRLRGRVPSKNTPPAALSWSSLFGDSFSESFRFCTMLFPPAENRNFPRTLSLSPDFLDTSPQIRYNRGNATAYPAVNQKWERNVAR